MILETHSEYIISRLALRVVEQERADQYINIQLVTQTPEEGTTYQRAEISESGSIKWPSGFFDETSVEAFEILKAGARRRAGEAAN